MHHPTFIVIRKQPFFPWARREEEIYRSLPGPTCAVTSLPLWLHVIECLEMKPRYSITAKPCSQEIRSYVFRNFKLHEVKDEWVLPSEPTSPVGPPPVLPWRKRTANIPQNWTNGFAQRIEYNSSESQYSGIVFLSHIRRFAATLNKTVVRTVNGIAANNDRHAIRYVEVTVNRIQNPTAATAAATRGSVLLCATLFTWSITVALSSSRQGTPKFKF